eukprot:7567910-Pyramimonas_sp.AAC.1
MARTLARPPELLGYRWVQYVQMVSGGVEPTAATTRAPPGGACPPTGGFGAISSTMFEYSSCTGTGPTSPR